MNKIIVENDTMRFYSTPVPIPVGGSQWSKIFFMFSDEWEDLRKIAQFRQGELKINVDIDSNNFCYVPNEMLPDMCGELSIVGYPQDTASATIATANSLMLNFVQGFESGGEPAVPPTPDLYQKLIKEFAESGGGNPDAVLYSKQELTEEQQKQARTNINVTKSYQIPTRVSGNNLLVDGWAAAGYPSGFDIIASDIERGALPYFVADDCIFLCTGIHHSARDSIIFVSGTVDYSDLSKIVYKNAYWESGTSIIDIQTMEVSQHDIEERAQTAYFYVGSYGYIYGQYYEELAGDNPKQDIPKKYPFAVVDGKFNNAILPLLGIYEETKQIVYARTDLTPDEKFKMQGLIVGDMTTPLRVIDIDIPLYAKPADGIPKSDLASDVQTSLAKADTAISLGLTAAAPGQIIKVKTVQDGKPTEWEAVDMPSGDKWEKLYDGTIQIEQETMLVEVDIPRSDSAKEFHVYLHFAKNVAEEWDSNKQVKVHVNGAQLGYSIIHDKLTSDFYCFAKQSFDTVRRVELIKSNGINPETNILNIFAQLQNRTVYEQTNTGKIRISFAAAYAGSIELLVYGRY